NPYRDGTTPIVLEPLHRMARLAALVPPPRMHLTRYHGVFAPHSKWRAAITPARRGPGGKGAEEGADQPATARPVAMSWAQRLKRVFEIEIDSGARCHGRLAGDREHRRPCSHSAHAGASGSSIRPAGAGAGAAGCAGTATAAAAHAAVDAGPCVGTSSDREAQLRRIHGRGMGPVAPAVGRVGERRM
ncbi:MAG: transposase, partial [Steroidobacteraceae bacterium]